METNCFWLFLIILLQSYGKTIVGVDMISMSSVSKLYDVVSFLESSSPASLLPLSIIVCPYALTEDTMILRNIAYEYDFFRIKEIKFLFSSNKGMCGISENFNRHHYHNYFYINLDYFDYSNWDSFFKRNKNLQSQLESNAVVCSIQTQKQKSSSDYLDAMLGDTFCDGNSLLIKWKDIDVFRKTLLALDFNAVLSPDSIFLSHMNNLYSHIDGTEKLPLLQKLKTYYQIYHIALVTNTYFNRRTIISISSKGNNGIHHISSLHSHPPVGQAGYGSNSKDTLHVDITTLPLQEAVDNIRNDHDTERDDGLIFIGDSASTLPLSSYSNMTEFYTPQNRLLLESMNVPLFPWHGDELGALDYKPFSSNQHACKLLRPSRHSEVYQSREENSDTFLDMKMKNRQLEVTMLVNYAVLHRDIIAFVTSSGSDYNAFTFEDLHPGVFVIMRVGTTESILPLATICNISKVTTSTCQLVLQVDSERVLNNTRPTIHVIENCDACKSNLYYDLPVVIKLAFSLDAIQNKEKLHAIQLCHVESSIRFIPKDVEYKYKNVNILREFGHLVNSPVQSDDASNTMSINVSSSSLHWEVDYSDIHSSVDMTYRRRDELYLILNSLQLAGGLSVEVGVHRGLFAERIMSTWTRGGKHIMVDPWISSYWEPVQSAMGDGIFENQQDLNVELNINYTETLLNIEPFGNRAVVLHMLSKHAANIIADHTVSFIYIDAIHEYYDVMVDMRAWWRTLKPGGIMAGHDYNAISEAVHEFTRKMRVKLYVTNNEYIEYSESQESGKQSGRDSRNIIFGLTNPSWFFYKPHITINTYLNDRK